MLMTVPSLWPSSWDTRRSSRTKAVEGGVSVSYLSSRLQTEALGEKIVSPPQRGVLIANLPRSYLPAFSEAPRSRLS